MIGISSAVVMADEVSKQMFNHEQTQQFLEVLDQFVSQAIEDVTGPATDVQDEDAMNQVFSAIAFQFFAAGIVWGTENASTNEDLNGAGNPDFTVAVETTEFIAALVRNGSITVRFAMEDNNEME
jgi:hypothetical protein